MNQPIRILHIVTYMGRGGLETMLMNYYRNIDRAKVQFDFLVHRDFKADYDDEIKSLGGKIFRIRPLNPFSISYYKELYNFFKSHKYNIVHSHLDCMSAVPLLVAKLCKVRIRIAHAHSAKQDVNAKYPLKIILKLFIKCFATQLFACSKKAGLWTFKTKKFDLLNNAINVENFSKARISDSLSYINEKVQNKYIIGHVGRFEYPKNHKFLIEIFNEILKTNNDSILILVGNGTLLKEIKQKTEELNISENVLFTDNITNVNEILKIFDIFVFPSIYEGFPVTSVEAQAAGLPCILSDNITHDCKITEDVHFVSLNKSPEFWAKKILEFKNYKKKDNSEKIIQAGFDIKENAKWLENYYIDKVNNL